ncbi:putative norphogenetic protein [Escherichia coli]|uniref:Putative norphogenetic protein n=1 Tax=Escherichia coli TaxID=562 RepID=A0A376WT59_ECOLX|nr:putative norphogenetic protein [Escherichia coli]
MLRFTEEEFQAFSERRNKGRSRPKTKKDPFLSLAPVKEVSPHAKALAALAKNPDLRDGNCEHFEQVFIFDYFERKPLTSMSCCMQRLTEGNVQKQPPGK